MSVGEWGSLQGYIGARAAEEARIGEFWPDEYESQSHGTKWEPCEMSCGIPVSWTEMHKLGGSASLEEAEAAADAHFRSKRRSEFFNRLKEAQRCRRFLSKALFREARTMEDLYLLIDLVVQFDKETPAWMKLGAASQLYGLDPIKDLWEFVSHWFTKVEARLRERMRHKRYQLDLWIERHLDEVVYHDGAEGFLKTFRVTDQLKIARWAIKEDEYVKHLCLWENVDPSNFRPRDVYYAGLQ